MGRGLLWVQLVDKLGQKWTFMTSHLESTKGTANFVNLSRGEGSRLNDQKVNKKGQLGTSDFREDLSGH